MCIGRDREEVRTRTKGEEGVKIFRIFLYSLDILNHINVLHIQKDLK